MKGDKLADLPCRQQDPRSKVDVRREKMYELTCVTLGVRTTGARGIGEYEGTS
jgi:hypothetical protein